MNSWMVPFAKVPFVAVIRLQGTDFQSGGRGGLDDVTLGPLIEKAFSRANRGAVALQINLAGRFAPVQSSLIAARIRRLSEEKNMPVYAFVEDVAASGGYWLACAADEIYVDEPRSSARSA